MVAKGDDGREIVKLVDFGIAKTFDEGTKLTSTGFPIGTPHYMPPEQASGGAVDARSDLYSVGVILYEMLTGDVPFDDTSTPAILHQASEGTARSAVDQRSRARCLPRSTTS